MVAGPSEEELDRQEVSFLEDIYQLMQAAHFRLLSEEDWATAQDEEFTVRISHLSNTNLCPLACEVVYQGW